MLRLLPLLFASAAVAADPLPDGAERRLGQPPRFNVDHSAAISPDGERIATMPPNAATHLWKVESGKLLSGSQYGSRPSLLAWSKEGKLRGLFQGYESLLLHEWADDTASGPDEKTLAELWRDPDPLAKRPYLKGKSLSPDGRRVAFLYELTNRDGEARVYTPKPNALCRLAEPDFTLTLPGCEWVGFGGDDTLLAVQPNLNRGGGRVLAYDLTVKKPHEPAWVFDPPAEEPKYEERDGKRFAVQGKGRIQRTVSADGKRVVMEFPYGTFEVWDGPTAKKLHSWDVPWYVLPGSGERALSALSPDGKRLAISSREKTGLVGGAVYDLDTGKEAVKLAAAPLPAHGALKYSPDGKRLYRSFEVWDAETGKALTPAAGHRGGASSMVVSGDGKTLVTSGQDLTVRGWDPDSGKEKWRADFPYPVTAWRLDANTAVLSVRSGSRWIEKPLIALDTGKVSELPGELAAGTKGSALRGDTQEPLLAVSPDGKTAVTADRQSPALKVWDWPSGKLRSTLAFDPPDKGRFGGAGVAFTPDGKELVGLFQYPDAEPMQGSGPPFRGVMCFERWDVAAGKRVERTTFKWSAVPSLATDGKRFLLANGDTLTDALSGEVIFSPTEEERQKGRSRRFSGAVLSPDGSTLAVPDGWAGDGKIRWYDLKSGMEVRTVETGSHSGVGAAFLPDGRLVSGGDEVLVWKAVK